MPLRMLLYLTIALAVAHIPKVAIAAFCRLYGHQTAVIDKRLYIDGGWLYANPIPQNPVPIINQGLQYANLDVQNDYNFPPVYANLSKNASVPDVAGGILWADQVNKVIWLYGGEYSSTPSTFQLWGYDVVLNQWNVSSAAASASTPIQRVSYGAGTTISELGKGYYYGGYSNKFTTPFWTGSPYATNSLIIFDMDENILTNTTGLPDGVGRAEGVMVSVSASTSGMLVYFGGVSYPYSNSTEAPQPMEYVMLYDIGDERWYTQRTTGDIPPNRRKFCGGVAKANDSSSYNIYIYGGLGFGENSTGLDDLYILTMPTFQWIKWFPLNNETERPHGFATCNIIDNAQMLIMGGNFSADSDCDNTGTSGLHNVNLGQNDPTDSKWYQFMPNLTTYRLPPAIVSAVGGSPTGAATSRSPPGGWSDPAIQVYFKREAQYQIRTPTRSLPASTSSAPHDRNTPNRIGIIAGAAIGGAAVIFVTAFLVFWCCRRTKKHRKVVLHDVATPGQPTELSAISPNEKSPPTAVVSGLPTSSRSPGSSPQSIAMHAPANMSPVYAYQAHHGQPDSTYQGYYQHVAPLQQYPHQQMYGYHHYPQGNTSPPTGWTVPHYGQQYFPPPDVWRTSPPAHEMPIAMSPSSASARPAMYEDADRTTHYPPPAQHVHHGSITARKELGIAQSPSTTTRMTETYSETGRSR